MNDKLKHPLAVLADRIAAEAHEGQTRKWSAVPYIVHPRRVAALAAALEGTDEVDVAAALLHDVVEDTPVTAGELVRLLVAGGASPDAVPVVVALVEELTKSYRSEEALPREEKRRRDWAKLRTISSRAKRLKLCDRIDNLVGGETMPPDLLEIYLAESRQVADLCGPADPDLAARLRAVIERLSA